MSEITSNQLIDLQSDEQSDENSILPRPGRVKSRKMYEQAVAYLKFLYLLNILVMVVWAIIATVLILLLKYLQLQGIANQLYVLVGVGSVTKFLVLYCIKFKRISLLEIIRNAHTMFLILTILGTIICNNALHGSHYFLVTVILQMLGYLCYLKILIKKWPNMDEQRWLQYMNPSSKFIRN